MKQLRLLLPLLLALTALPAIAQVNDAYVIPAAINKPGAYGTFWMTRISVFNPQSYKLTVSLTFLPTAGAIGREELIDIPANSIAWSDNILKDLYDWDGSGGLIVATFPEDNPGVANDMISRAFLVTTSTYNNAQSGTYAQTVPGVWTGLQDYANDPISAIAHGIRHVASLGWRTNVGAVNLGRYSAKMYVTVYNADGQTVLKNAEFFLPPLAHIQDVLPVEVNNGSVEFVVEDPHNDAIVFPYTSTVDQYSGDPTYQSPTLLASASLLFPSAMKAAALASPGKKIDTDIARRVRASAERLGNAALVHTAAGYQITRTNMTR